MCLGKWLTAVLSVALLHSVTKVLGVVVSDRLPGCTYDGLVMLVDSHLVQEVVVGLHDGLHHLFGCALACGLEGKKLTGRVKIVISTYRVLLGFRLGCIEAGPLSMLLASVKEIVD